MQFRDVGTHSLREIENARRRERLEGSVAGGKSCGERAINTTPLKMHFGKGMSTGRLLGQGARGADRGRDRVS